MRVPADELFHAFKDVPKPAHAKGCSQGCCMEDADVQALLDADQHLLTAAQLRRYLDAVFVTHGSVTEFIYLLPAMLKTWSEEIFTQAHESVFTQYFHAALGQRYEGVAHIAPSFLVTQLAPSLQQTVVAFMRESMLHRIGSETRLTVRGLSPTHLWFTVLAAYGVIVPDVEALWNAWWAYPSTGHAVAALQYASCVITGGRGNPIFAPWDRNTGGGAPCLWEYDSIVDEEWRWLPENRDFLQRTLTIPWLEERLSAADARLSAPSAHDCAEKLRRALAADPTRVQLRIDRLLEMLNTPNGDVRLDASFEDRKR